MNSHVPDESDFEQLGRTEDGVGLLVGGVANGSKLSFLSQFLEDDVDVALRMGLNRRVLNSIPSRGFDEEIDEGDVDLLTRPVH